METTINTGDRVLGFKTAYTFSDPERGDIVVFNAPDEPQTLYIKRIVGLPGETVEIKEGQTYINGKELYEGYINPSYYQTDLSTENYGPYSVPEGCYFMMGDNRGDSADSRYWNSPFVPKEEIVGKAMWRYWPFRDMGRVE